MPPVSFVACPPGGGGWHDLGQVGFATWLPVCLLCHQQYINCVFICTRFAGFSAFPGNEQGRPRYLGVVRPANSPGIFKCLNFELIHFFPLWRIILLGRVVWVFFPQHYFLESGIYTTGERNSARMQLKTSPTSVMSSPSIICLKQ